MIFEAQYDVPEEGIKEGDIRTVKTDLDEHDIEEVLKINMGEGGPWGWGGYTSEFLDSLEDYKIFTVCGKGPAQSKLIRQADMDFDDVRECIKRGYLPDEEWTSSDDYWAVSIIATEDELDADTRFDDSVIKYF